MWLGCRCVCGDIATISLADCSHMWLLPLGDMNRELKAGRKPKLKNAVSVFGWRGKWKS